MSRMMFANSKDIRDVAKGASHKIFVALPPPWSSQFGITEGSQVMNERDPEYDTSMKTLPLSRFIVIPGPTINRKPLVSLYRLGKQDSRNMR